MKRFTIYSVPNLGRQGRHELAVFNKINETFRPNGVLFLAVYALSREAPTAKVSLATVDL